MQNDTTKNSLLHFSEQLRTWALERFRQRPGPFRHVELTDRLIGEQQIISPPVTFWVNRESLIAGAVLLVPPANEEESFRPGREFANILGLPCFFTWGRHEISCWSLASDPPEKEWSYDLPPDDISSPATFRKSFNLLIDQLEKSFFNHQQSIPHASPLHLANLVYATFNDLLPMLQQAMQIENPEHSGGPSAAAGRANSLLRQLLLPPALAAHDLLPFNTPVNKIVDELAEAAKGLPQPLARTFTLQSSQLHLSKECLRRYNHFVSRVAQLSQEFTTNLGEVTTLLLGKLAPKLGGRHYTEPRSDLDRLVVNPDRCDLDKLPAIEIAGSGILAACALTREIRGSEGPPPRQLPSVMSLNRKLPHHHVVGTLHETALPQPEERKKLNALLRVSWPNHKLSLPPRTPAWVWQLVHLCGLMETDSLLELAIPKNWLWERYGENIPDILDGKAVFSKIVDGNDNLLNCTIIPAPTTDATVVRPDGSGRVLPYENPKYLRSQILIALNMPEEVFNLLASGELQYYPAERVENMSARGLGVYLLSSLGRHFWTLLAPGRSTPDGEKVASECIRLAIPLPREKTVASLGALRADKELSLNDIDQELMIWLGITTDIKKITRQRVSSSRDISTEDQLDKFRTACAGEEIPVFPENYLYEIPTADRVEVSFHGRLKVVDSFFDETVLQDREKQEIRVQGTPQKEALLLLSTARSGPIEIPADQQSMTTALDRYIRDLKVLRQNFYRHAIACLSEEDVLGKVDEIWKKHSLPDWSLVKER